MDASKSMWHAIRLSQVSSYNTRTLSSKQLNGILPILFFFIYSCLLPTLRCQNIFGEEITIQLDEKKLLDYWK